MFPKLVPEVGTKHRFLPHYLYWQSRSRIQNIFIEQLLITFKIGCCYLNHKLLNKKIEKKKDIPMTFNARKSEKILCLKTCDIF